MSDFPVVGSHVPRRGNALTRWLGRWLLRLWGWRVVDDLPDVPKAVVVCAPHTSNVDGLVVAGVVMALQVRIKVMAKHSLFRAPFGGFFRWIGGLPIDRDKAGGIVGQSAQKFSEYEQLWVGVAPEGTRKGADSWKTGFYRIAQKAGVPITLAVMDYGTRTIRFPLTFMPSGDVDADLARMMACYQGVIPHRPERLSRPLRELADRSR